MKLENLPIQQNNENLSTIRNGSEGSSLADSLEMDPEKNIEKEGLSAEFNSIISEVNTVASIPAPIADDSNVVNNTLNIDDLAAKDDELIKRKWVDKAKKIVAETSDDPHKQEEAVNQLQSDYLREIHGRGLETSVKKSN